MGASVLDFQPELSSDLVVLRPLREEHFKALYHLAKDPLVWEQHQDPDRYQVKAFEEYFKVGLATKMAFAIFDTATNTIIGSSRYRIVDQELGVCEIGWSFLGRPYWGGAYNSAFKTLMVNHALKYFKIIVFYVHPNNIRSQRAMEKLGAQRQNDRENTWVRPIDQAISYTLRAPLID